MRRGARGYVAGVSSEREFEHVGGETVYEGAIITVEHERYRYADGEEVERDVVRHPGAVGDRLPRRRGLWLVKQPRQAVDDPDVLEIPAGKLDEEGESPLDAGSASSPRRSARARSSGSRSARSGPASASSTRRSTSTWRPACTTSAPRRTRTSASRWSVAAARLDELLDTSRTRRRGSGCSSCTAGARLGETLHRRGARRAGANHVAWRLPRRGPTSAASSITCSISWPTWSSSAGCRATRSRPIDPTCCSSAATCSARAWTFSPPSTAPRGLPGRAAPRARTERRPVAAATLQRKAACLRSFYRHLRREELIDARPDRRAARRRARARSCRRS